jgi:uncharacterized protein
MPVRTCIGCRRTDEQRNLVRMVADQAGRIRIDLPRRRPGRGTYVHNERDCIEELVRRGALARSLKRKIETMDADALWSRVRQAEESVRPERRDSSIRSTEIQAEHKET